MAQHAYAFPNTSSTLSLLTDEELEQIERVWIELIMWKKSQTH
ncbi:MULTISPECIES: 3-demethylubiquinone-9 3-methyltransferase [Vibrio]|uniref:3-demethylubiquinone-9 3-methyltransferase n=1 Tax=Vibrio rhizosphaerae TaxID=398736 RepID=A0ABU4IU12_9VIBR|nr:MULTISPECIES: 3-demethylubiquinone-9 3-methyltransferase [Vibrio]MDW6092860.1 3-demethylubiquinone-9 3-methyltransferase [Vibrio rhizosphaerae]WNJ97114.1 3-demethylubiquinone-9 3-methyltransferase [Vibrio ruber]